MRLNAPLVTRISYSVVVEVPPSIPVLRVQAVGPDTVQLAWTVAAGPTAILGYVLAYRPAEDQVGLDVFQLAWGTSSATILG
jgi:hypothetical protein